MGGSGWAEDEADGPHWSWLELDKMQMEIHHSLYLCFKTSKMTFLKKYLDSITFFNLDKPPGFFACFNLSQTLPLRCHLSLYFTMSCVNTSGQGSAMCNEGWPSPETAAEGGLLLVLRISAILQEPRL